MLLCRYGSLDYVFNLDIDSGVRQILKAVQKNDEERHWEMWLANLPHMNKKTFVPFGKFYRPKSLDSQVLPTRTKEEILSDAEMILASFRKGE